MLPRSRYDEFVAALTAAVAELIVGDPADRVTDIGPLINEAARAAGTPRPCRAQPR
ncbi:hypothetical protein MAHJHV55_52090 [Mycobacterium avium subsp. hominissuis]